VALGSGWEIKIRGNHLPQPNGMRRTASPSSIYTDVTCLKKMSISVGRVKKQVAKNVHSGLPQDSFETLVPCVQNYCACKILKKLSISAVGLKKKLRRLSTVGSIYPYSIEEEATRSIELLYGFGGYFVNTLPIPSEKRDKLSDVSIDFTPAAKFLATIRQNNFP